MTGNEIRKRFTAFFQRHGHLRLDSSGLIPRNDPTLMFANSGMVQFKSYFLGEERPQSSRVVTVQKCVRAGGKHNDLEKVGRTARHHTFFEMLGNFSFGDYFKEEAIAFGWQFVTEELGLARDRLLVTVYDQDEVAYDIWRNKMGLPEEKVIRIATSDNFWSMGDTGPCGPCSEIFYDHGPEIAGGPPGSEDAEGDRFVEIWNLVFMQYNRDADGVMTPLPNPCIDTGAGLERITAILQGKHNNFDSDLFQGVIQAAARIANTAYGADTKSDVSLRVIADHLRAMSFLITDGVLPANEGRGYVLRRIMRRAMRHGRLLGLEEPFLHTLAPILAGSMGDAYPELIAQEAFIAMVIQNEEKRFVTTLGSGLKILEEALGDLPAGAPLDGSTIFTLYDTFGFPVDLTADIAGDRGVGLDLAGFEERMAEQRKRARAAWSGSGEARISALYPDLRERFGATEFLGYVTLTARGSLHAIIHNGQEVGQLQAGEEGELLVNQTPFYGESGGQVGDIGQIVAESGALFQVRDTIKPIPDLIIHRGILIAGQIAPGDGLTLAVDERYRNAIRLHHSATHYLHHALRQVVGAHVKQAGSRVDADRLRFDFSHFQALTPIELAEVEDRVNAGILANALQQTEIMTPAEAVAAGAMALFGEKYGDEVRVVRIGETRELCGGTHVTRSGDIGLFRIVSESAVAAGVRRIEAVCGETARHLLLEEAAELRRAANLLKSSPSRVAEGVDRLLGRIKELERAMEKAQSERAGNIVEELASNLGKVGDIPLLIVLLDQTMDVKALRDLTDRLKDKLGSAVILLAAPAAGGKLSLIAGVTKGLSGRCRAGDLMQVVARELGGKGGGQAEMAQGGGEQPERWPQAVVAVEQWLGQK